MAAKKRKYQLVWERIKLNKQCTVQVNLPAQRRLKKAISKEKDQDKEFHSKKDAGIYYLSFEHPILDGVAQLDRLKITLNTRRGL
jgi:hypothetical protein